jgi:predicted TIM-barrel fold metal-dependent hydrolase
MGYEVMLPTLRKFISAWGPQRVLFGSDGIFNFEETIKAVNRADFLSEEDRKKIFFENAQRVLQLS